LAFSLDPPKQVKADSIVSNDSLSITIGWGLSKDDRALDTYQIFRSQYGFIGSVVQESLFVDKNGQAGHQYYYDVVKKQVVKVHPKIDAKTKTLSWQIPQKALGFTDVEVFRDGKKIGNVTPDRVTFVDPACGSNSKYEIRILKIVSIPSKVLSDTTIKGKRQITIKWKRPNDLYLGERYEINRMDQAGEYDLIGSVIPGAASFKDTTMKDGIKYFYKIAAVKGGEQMFSEPSAALSTVGIPQCLVAQDVPNDEGEGFIINWELSPNDGEIKSYILLRLVYDSLASFKNVYAYTDTAGKPGVDYRYTVVKTYQIVMPAKIVADSLGKTGRVIRSEWRLHPKVVGQDYDIIYMFRAEKGAKQEFKYVDFTSPKENKFIDGTAELGKEYIYEARALKEISISYRITDDRSGGNRRTTTLVWKPSHESKEFQGYVVNRADRVDGSYGAYARLGQGVNSYTDRVAIFNGVPYAYRLVALTKDNEQAASVITPYLKSYPQWFHARKINALIAVVIFIGLVLYFIQVSKKGKEMFVRRIAGLSAVDEAVGRATEMGRPILYVPGTTGMDDVATIASLNILGQVAQKTAQYGTPLIVPIMDPIVFTVAREIVKEAYTTVGRPDAFNPDSVYYVTSNQFAYAAAVNGIMEREKPATNFLVGMFYAESLLMAETGASTGAIQIAGTDAVTQLPFFITACDYTLIGEELYAASAYLSRNPSLLATLKSQDYGKLIIVGIMIVASIIALAKIGVPIFNFFNVF
jgi:hypothetical protein